MNPMLESFPFIVQGLGSDEESAKRDFDSNLKRCLLYIRGTKYWRMKPSYIKDRDFDSLHVEHRWVGRAFAVLEPLEGRLAHPPGPFPFEEIKEPG